MAYPTRASRVHDLPEEGIQLRNVGNTDVGPSLLTSFIGECETDTSGLSRADDAGVGTSHHPLWRVASLHDRPALTRSTDATQQDPLTLPSPLAGFQPQIDPSESILAFHRFGRPRRGPTAKAIWTTAPPSGSSRPPVT